jgi:branched-chain amino acid transport system substrate-binding protein
VRGMVVATGVALALGIGAVGVSDASLSSPRPTGSTVDVYASLPLQGRSSAQSIPTLAGIRLALAQAGGRAGQFRVRLISLDDTTAAAGDWDPAQTAANARRAASDRRVVYYIGEFNSGASEVSIPILNQAGIPQVSPDNTYDGLTVRAPGTAPAEPTKWYPTGVRTYLRIAARDSVQASALLSTMRSDRCRTVAVANDREAYGFGLAALVKVQASGYGVRVVSNTAIDPTARNYGSYTHLLASEQPGCFLFAGIVSDNPARVTEAAALGAPKARLLGGDAICTTAFTDPAVGGLPRALGRRFRCTQLPLALNAYPGGRQFLNAYRARYHRAAPDAHAIYGYEAMKLGLDTIARLGTAGSDRRAIRNALFATKHRRSVIGTYSFDRHGDTTLRSYGLYGVQGPHGKLAFVGNALNP